MKLVWLEEATSLRVKMGGMDFIPGATTGGLRPDLHLGKHPDVWSRDPGGRGGLRESWGALYLHLTES